MSWLLYNIEEGITNALFFTLSDQGADMNSK